MNLVFFVLIAYCTNVVRKKREFFAECGKEQRENVLDGLCFLASGHGLFLEG